MSMSLFSCQSSSDEIVLGMEKSYGNTSWSSQVSCGLKVKKVQPLAATFDVYIGAITGFQEEWETNAFDYNPDNASFAIERRIMNLDNEIIKQDFFVVEDFPNDEKYPLKYKHIEGTTDGTQKSFETSIPISFDFASLDVEKGYIGYGLFCYDTVNQKPLYDSKYYSYGISNPAILTFEKGSETVTIDYK